MPDRAPAGGEHDRVRLHVLADPPGEIEIAQLVGGRRALGHDLGGGRRGGVAIARLHQEAARDAAQLDARPARLGRDVADEQPQVLARREDRQRLGLEGGRDHALEEGLLISRASSPSTARFTATMPPNADTGSVSRARR